MEAIETPRMRLEPLTLDDAPFIAALVNTPGWLRFIGDRQVASVEDARRFLARGFLRCRDEHGFGYWRLETQDGTPAGICGFLKKAHLAHPDLGFALMPASHGAGLAQEAARAVMAHGRAAHGLTIIDAEVHPDNAPSRRLLERLGFDLTPTPEGWSGDALLYRSTPAR